MAILVLVACALAFDLPSAGAATLKDEVLVPYIINGRPSSISEFPWQVYILLYDEAEGLEASCGGSILDATHILTAAHCVDHAGTTTSYPPIDLAVAAGAQVVENFGAHVEPAPGDHWQQDYVKSFRTDPYYTVKPEIKDDVAVLELAKPLTLTPEFNSQPISLVPTGDTPAPGTALSVSGYGKEEGAEGAEHNSNGKLYSTTLTAISSDACRKEVGVNSAVLLCAVSPTSSSCQGDSGGPLTEGSPAVQVGIVDFGARECPVGVPGVLTNVAAPEVRDFIEGSESPPIAARPTSAPVISSAGAAPVDLSPLTCEPGEWTGSPTFTYTFQVESASVQVLQTGSGNIFTPPSALVGSSLVCVVQASNPGGVSTARSAMTSVVAAAPATTTAVTVDIAAPTSKITRLKCHLHMCTLSFTASDGNGMALSGQASATYPVAERCPKKKRRTKGRKSAKQPVCHKTKTVPMSVTNPSSGAYTAAMSGLPYNEKITFIADASNAAGMKAPPASTATTLHKPAPTNKEGK